MFRQSGSTFSETPVSRQAALVSMSPPQTGQLLINLTIAPSNHFKYNGLSVKVNRYPGTGGIPGLPVG
jgi:hypothetical protein